MADVHARVRKLLALGKSANEHEAAAAALAVARVLAAHRLTLDEVLAAEILARQVLQPKEPWAQALLAVVAAGCGCRLLLTGPVARVIGTALDVDTALTLHARLTLQIHTLAMDGWKRHVADLTDPHYGVYPSLLEPGAEAEWKTSFALGAVGVVQDRLGGAPGTAQDPGLRGTSEAADLVRLDLSRAEALRRADEYVRARWPGARQTKHRTYRLHLGALTAGKGSHVG